MLTAVRRLATADFIAVVNRVAADVCEVGASDPVMPGPATFRAPFRWTSEAVPVQFDDVEPRRLLPSVLLCNLPSEPQAVCVVHGPRDANGDVQETLVLVWYERDAVPAMIHTDAASLQQLLVDRTSRGAAPLPAIAARLDAIMSHVPQGVVFVDVSHGEAIVNAAAAGWLQIRPGVVRTDELWVAMVRLFLRLRNGEFVRREAERITSEPNARIDDWTWELDDTTGVTLRVMSVPITEPSGHGRLWTFDDVSHERALLRELAQHRIIEEKLKQVQKLEIVGRLAASVAHDFNNLLTIIGGSVEMLADAPLDSVRRADLHNIGNATDRARRLTRQLLTFTRQQVEQSETFVLDDRLRETEPLLRKVIAPNRQLILHLASNGAEVFTDPHQIELALLNLLANARDAMSDGGTITLRTAVEQIDGEKVLGSTNRLAGTHVAISVMDTGTGFDERTREKIFEPFFTTKPAGQGTGLGLATTLSIAERAGGGIRCSSVRGQGSVFTILLPCVNPSRHTTTSPPIVQPTPERPPPLCVLLVDDDPGPRETLRRLLIHEGFRVETADSAAVALSIMDARGSDIGAIVTDYTMPVMSGRELLERVRTQWPRLPAILISGYTPDRDTANALQRLHSGFLAKPFTGRQLAEEVRHQLGIAAELVPR